MKISLHPSAPGLTTAKGLVAAAMSGPSWPQFADNVRRATPRDLQRLGLVAACGFFHSPVFPFERVFHKKYPGETLIDYRKMLRSILLDPNSILLVALDDAVDESECTPASILKAAHDEGDTEIPTGKVVVGFASFKLNSNSKRNQSEEESWRKNIEDKKPLDDAAPPEGFVSRDISVERGKEVSAVSQQARPKYFPDGLVISIVAIHPAYFRRGHASRLIQYAKDLSKIDGIQIGVVSVPNGRALVEHLGFKVHEVYHVQANDELDAPQEVHIAASTFDDNVST